MNPKISITVDAKNKAIASLTGMVTVGAKVDVEVCGIVPESVPDWDSDDDFIGKSLRFRIVDECGRDLVRFPLVKKGDGTDGDKWTVDQDGAFVTQTGVEGGPFVDFNTHPLRNEFCGVSFSDALEFGVILDSIVDDAQYAVGRMKVRQWSACPTDDPTILPDWRDTLKRLDDDLAGIEQSKADAIAAKDAAISAKDVAVSAKESAELASGDAFRYKNAASGSANAASESASSASSSASSAATSAEQAAGQVVKYPYIDSATRHWMVWNATEGEFVDTEVVAEGQKGEDGEDGEDGVGVPAGGTQGQVLAKKSGTDFDTEWVDQQGGAGILGKLPLRALPKYLHFLAFDDTYPADAEWLYAQLGPSDLGRCSAVRRGGKLWRNYDWTFDDAAEFVVKIYSSSSRFGSVGVASVGSRLTENEVMSAVNSRYYKCLPGMTLDGINENGVVCEINVDGGPKDGWHGDAADDGIHILAAVRWALDHGETAELAAEWLADHIVKPTGEMNFHFMVADSTKTYIVENGVAHLLGTDDDKVLTNFGVFDGDHAGEGRERYQILAGGADIKAAWFTNAYQSGNTWDSDFASAEQHAEAIRQWAEQGTDKEAHRGKTTSGGKAWWQSVHTTEYDLSAKTMKVAVQEADDWYTFAVDAVPPSVTVDDTVTQTSANPVKSSGIWTWVKSLLPSWLTPSREEPPTQASVAAKYTKPAGGIPKTDLSSAVQSSLDNADAAIKPNSDVKVSQYFTLRADNVFDIQWGRLIWYDSNDVYWKFEGVCARAEALNMYDSFQIKAEHSDAYNEHVWQICDGRTEGMEFEPIVIKPELDSVDAKADSALSAASSAQAHSEMTRGMVATKADRASIAPEYSATSAYSVGQFVYHEGNIYQCVSSTTGAWDSTKWVLRKLDDFFGESNSILAATIAAKSAQLALDDDGEIIVTMNTED